MNQSIIRIESELFLHNDTFDTFHTDNRPKSFIGIVSYWLKTGCVYTVGVNYTEAFHTEVLYDTEECIDVINTHDIYTNSLCVLTEKDIDSVVKSHIKSQIEKHVMKFLRLSLKTRPY